MGVIIMIRNKQVKKSISIGQVSIQGVDGMTQQPQLPDAVLQKIMNSLALSIARKIVAESAETLQALEIA